MASGTPLRIVTNWNQTTPFTNKRVIYPEDGVRNFLRIVGAKLPKLARRHNSEETSLIHVPFCELTNKTHLQ